MKRILLSPGEPAGIGPDIIIQIAQESFDAELIVVSDPELLRTRAKLLNLPLTLIPYNENETIPHKPGQLTYLPTPLNAPVEVGKLNSRNANYVLTCLEIATDFCLKHNNSALVTGPIHKGILNEAGIAFTGHTEFLADRCRVSQSLMLFVTPQTKVALVTTHLPLAKVSENITHDKLLQTIRLLALGLQQQFGVMTPKILVCGLNPHAGEQGHLGREEIDIIAPALARLHEENINCIGPVSADTAFTTKNFAEVDAILAMYHDQALPVVKYMSFGQAVNVTLGLPIIRTSVDHGTALDVAGTLSADPNSMIAAMKVALSMLGSQS